MKGQIWIWQCKVSRHAIFCMVKEGYKKQIHDFYTKQLRQHSAYEESFNAAWCNCKVPFHAFVGSHTERHILRRLCHKLQTLTTKCANMGRTQRGVPLFGSEVGLFQMCGIPVNWCPVSICMWGCDRNKIYFKRGPTECTKATVASFYSNSMNLEKKNRKKQPFLSQASWVGSWRQLLSIYWLLSCTIATSFKHFILFHFGFTATVRNCEIITVREMQSGRHGGLLVST